MIQPRGRLRRSPFFLFGCLAGGLFLLVVGWSFLNLMTIRECNAPRNTFAESLPWTVTLDAEHPLAEQDVTVELGASALPADIDPDGVRLAIKRNPQVVLNPDGSTPPAPSAIDVELTFVDGATNEVVARLAPIDDIGTEPYLQTDGIPIDCAPGEVCSRSYRLALSLADAATAEPVEVSWSVVANVEYSGWGGCNGPPNASRPSLEIAEPLVRPAAAVARAEVEQQPEAGTIVTRHVVVTTPNTTGTAVARLRIQRAPQWLSWVRVIPDDGATPLVDASVDRFYASIPDAVADVPVLTGCAQLSACTRGYWLIVQSFPYAPDFFDPRWAAEPGHGSFTLSPSARGFADPAAPIEVTIGPRQDDLGPAPSVETELISVPMTPNVDRIVDATITIPERPPIDDGLDRLDAAFVVAHWTGHGDHVGATVEGPGAGPFGAGASGDGAGNLIAHPFGDCPDTGSCEVTIQLVSHLTDDPRSSMSGDPVSNWRLSLLGVPDTATVVFGAPRDRSVSGQPLVSIPPFVTLVVGIAAVLGLVWLLPLVRRRRTNPPDTPIASPPAA